MASDSPARSFKRARYALLIGTTLVLVLTIAAIMQLVKVTHFNLPLPTYFPVFAMILPSVTCFLSVFPLFSARVYATKKMFYPSILVAVIVFSSIFAALLAPYFSESLARSIHDSAWAGLFSARSPIVAHLQESMQCCGFDTLYDRAYPFPSKADAANACVLRYKFTQQCSTVWAAQTKSTATWCLTVFLVSLVFSIAALMHTIAAYRSTGRAAAQATAAASSIPAIIPRMLEPGYQAVSETERSKLLASQWPNERNEWAADNA
ncbi:uncharacterized protein V1510DRAFT_306358 [Dipodascopsis tothii]|uniref:uncharacterized protein n=1 Tax=Dipodascopsis tothii TaxID=44089 RepID=UPI0034CF3EBE